MNKQFIYIAVAVTFVLALFTLYLGLNNRKNIEGIKNQILIDNAIKLLTESNNDNSLDTTNGYNDTIFIYKNDILIGTSTSNN